MMLKGIANGVPKDITRIPMKGKNLYNSAETSWTMGILDDDGNQTSSSQSHYTSNFTSVFPGISHYLGGFLGRDQTAHRIYFYDANKRWISRTAQLSVDNRVFTPPAGCYYIQIQASVSVTGSDWMLNLGSTPLPYEPYGYQEGWEVRKGDGTLIWGRNDTISVNSGTLPIKGYGVPLKGVEVEGNMTQESPNLVNPADNVPGYQNNDGSIHVPGSGNEMTTDFLPFTGTIYARIKATTSGNINWVAYNSEKQALYFYGGNWSGANPSFTISPNTYYDTAYIRISWTQGATQPICVTTTQQSAFVPFEPEPDTPNWPDETGERTGNLFDWNWLVDGYHLSQQTGLPETNARRTSILQPIDVSSIGRLYISYDTIGNPNVRAMYSILDSNDTLIRRVTQIASGDLIDVSGGSKLYVAFYDNITSANTVTKNNVSNIMLNTGSTALPYEPFGYKITITNAGQTVPIYLGQMQTVRQIKKLVLTGEEAWSISNSRFYLASLTPDYLRGANQILAMCSHYVSSPQVTSAINVPAGCISFSYTSAQRLYCYDTSIATIPAFKQYLAEQYAAGTPVTVWYVLAEPQTAIVNEPIRKIGTYADTLTVTDQDVTITPADGNDTITVDTTLPPSALSITGHVKARSV